MKKPDLLPDRLSSVVWTIIAGGVLSRFGLTMSVPFITIFLYKHAHISLSIAGVIVAVSFITYILGGFFGGFLSDRIGRKRLLLLGLFLYALAFFGFGLTGSYLFAPYQIILAFFLCNSLAGLCRAWTEALGQAIIADICTAEQKRRAFSYRYIGVNVGAAIGPLVGVLFGISGSTHGFYTTGILQLFYFITFLVLLKNYHEHQTQQHIASSLLQSLLIITQDRAMRYFIIAGGIIYFGYVQQETLFSVIILNHFHTMHLLAVMLGINAFMAVFLQMPLTYFTRNFHPLKIMMLGSVFLAISLVIVGCANTMIVMYIIGEIIFTLGEMFILPLNGVVIDSLAPSHLRGTYFGAAGFQYIGRALGPIIGGGLMSLSGGKVTMFIIAIITLTSMIFYYWGYKYKKEE